MMPRNELVSLDFGVLAMQTKMSRKVVMGMVGIVGLLGAMGLSLTEALEYAQVAQANVANAVQSELPLSIEIDRMEVILGKLQQQLSGQNREVAKAQVALEDADAALERDRDQADALLREMQLLRVHQTSSTTSCGKVQIGCHTVTAADVRGALARKLASYESICTAVSQREQMVERQRQAYHVLATRFSDWNQERELLTHRLEALRSRHAAQQAATGQDITSFDSTDLARASQLAEEIEQKLRIAEKEQALGSAPLSHLLSPEIEEADVEGRIDQLLGARSSTASR